ncbi:Lsa family ABC-F type ribosomal protection protein [Tepiditoga spiralis]|uniref:Lsa family ABC-F type ribosomal protection protein n=1 Tax=Tepiditoga spiralis TaxID=2108365 RepID=A0A7G1G505_9BACT|nr:ATP-binding cassette domain-containing protein [Tepiditoga spiralis]BBE30104.1 Lsa family ABC-F type ribosomal protection protein [Tepiditoga spiralis]
MANIKLNNLSFYYTSPYKLIFQNLNLTINVEWKCGLVGKNGRGKTTLLKLLKRDLEPSIGEINIPIKVSYFPFKIEKKYTLTYDILKNLIAPFSDMEKKMDYLLQNKNINEYGEVLEKYTFLNGFIIDTLIEKEFNKMGLKLELLKRPYETLSSGEKTKIMIIAMFLRKDNYLLIDEPTNHLDISSREQLGKYLSKKKNFLVVSHDRYFLDLCIDHIISINKSNVKLLNTNYSELEYNLKLEEDFEKKKNEKIEKKVKNLKEALIRSKVWANNREKDKFKKYHPDTSIIDKGYVGGKAKKLMKMSKNFELNIQKNIEEQKGLLKNVEKNYELKIFNSNKIPNKLLQIYNLNVEYGNNTILKNFNLTLYKKERIAIFGKNGSGKTTLLKAIFNEINIKSGNIYKPKFINFSRVEQVSNWEDTTLYEYIQKKQINENKFRQILGNFEVRGEILDKQAKEFSDGEKKKIDLCLSIVDPVTVLIWDEPLNYIDIPTRLKLEKAILKYEPTMIFIEHDRYFIENIATKIIEIK